jgi:hypothetical protein
MNVQLVITNIRMCNFSKLNACNETNLMHYLSSVYSVTIPLYVWALLVTDHQEVTMCICDNWYEVYIYTLLPLDDGH